MLIQVSFCHQNSFSIKLKLSFFGFQNYRKEQWTIYTSYSLYITYVIVVNFCCLCLLVLVILNQSDFFSDTFLLSLVEFPKLTQVDIIKINLKSVLVLYTSIHNFYIMGSYFLFISILNWGYSITRRKFSNRLICKLW